jgi:glutaredoxin 3
MADVLVYTTDNCVFCRRVKQLLDTRGIAYEEVNLERDEQTRTELARKTGMMSFPQVLINGELVGGFPATAMADKSGKLAELLEAAA